MHFETPLWLDVWTWASSWVMLASVQKTRKSLEKKFPPWLLHRTNNFKRVDKNSTLAKKILNANNPWDFSFNKYGHVKWMKSFMNEMKSFNEHHWRNRGGQFWSKMNHATNIKVDKLQGGCNMTFSSLDMYNTFPLMFPFHAIRTRGFIFGHKRNIDHVEALVCLKIKFCDYWNAQATYATNQLKILFHNTNGKMGFIHEVIIQANPKLLNFVSNNVIKPTKNHILFIIKYNNKTLVNQWSIEMRVIVSLGI